MDYSTTDSLSAIMLYNMYLTLFRCLNWPSLWGFTVRMRLKLRRLARMYVQASGLVSSNAGTAAANLSSQPISPGCAGRQSNGCRKSR